MPRPLTSSCACRIEAFWRHDAREDAWPTAVLDGGPGAELATLVARQEIEYLLPLGITQDTIAYYRVADLGARTNDDKAKFMDLRLGAREERRSPLIRDFVPIAALNDLVFGAWDPIPDDALTAARKAGVLEAAHLEPVAAFLSGIRPMPAVFDHAYVPRLQGENVKRGATKRDLAEQLRADIRAFKATHGLDRVVVVWCASTEVYLTPGPQHASLAAFEAAMAANDPAIAPSMLYAWAAIMEGAPFANGAPNLTVDIPALQELAVARGVPISGKDFKTGQTWMKTVIAPGLKARMLGLRGWYSTNILGNRDGEVLDDPAAFKTKEEIGRAHV